MRLKNDKKGVIDIGLSEIPWFITAVIIAVSLCMLHANVLDVQSSSNAKQVCSDIAAMIDNIGSCPGTCSTIYELPSEIDGSPYEIELMDKILILKSNGKTLGVAGFSSRIKNSIIITGGSRVNIEKNEDGKIEISER